MTTAPGARAGASSSPCRCGWALSYPLSWAPSCLPYLAGRRAFGRRQSLVGPERWAPWCCRRRRRCWKKCEMSGTAGRIEAQGCFGCFGGAVRLFLGGRRLDLRRSCGWLRLGVVWPAEPRPAPPSGGASLPVGARPAARACRPCGAGFPAGARDGVDDAWAADGEARLGGGPVRKAFSRSLIWSSEKALGFP